MSNAQLIACPPIDLPERLLRTLATVLLQAADAWRRWQLQRAAAQQAWLAAALSEELNGALLRDIGAPGWLVGAAAARREADALRAQALRTGVYL